MLCRVGHVPRHHLPRHCPGERLVDNRVHLVDSRSAEASVESVLVEALHERGRKVLQLDPSQSWFDVVLDEVGVSIVCAPPDGAASY